MTIWICLVGLWVVSGVLIAGWDYAYLQTPPSKISREADTFFAWTEALWGPIALIVSSVSCRLSCGNWPWAYGWKFPGTK